MKWVIVMNKANYSKQQITEALIDLLQKTSIEDITITSLVTKAHVSRNAFYNNYQSVEDVLKEAYRQAHQKAFQNKYIDISYFTSDEAILDFIQFFGKNTALLLALQKWNLLPYIAKYNTHCILNSLEQSNNPFIHQYKEYFMIYHTIPYFQICYYWILSDKKETPQELFQMIKQLQKQS